VEGKNSSQDSSIGLVPTPGAIDIEGLGVTAGDMTEVSIVNIAEWREELLLIERWFETIGTKLPSQMEYQLRQLKAEIEQEELY